MKQFKNLTMKSFTLVEMLVVVGIFSLIVGAISGLFISGVSSQRRILANQELLDQTSYVLEYMGRALRMARKDLTGTCLLTAGYNYVNPGISSVRFLNYEGKCQEFFLERNQIKEKKSIDENSSNFQSPFLLTSPALKVNFLKFNLLGEAQPPTDYLQPRVTIFLEILGRGQISQPKIQIQTTISQRNLDVQY